jgi:prefoldin subunit 5
LEDKLEAEKLAILAIIQQQVDEINSKAKELEKILVEYAVHFAAIEKSLEDLGSAIVVLDGRLDEVEKAIEDLEERIAALEQDNHMVETMAVLLLTAGTILSFGAVYFIFGNRFFPVDTRRSYQHVYIKDGVSKIKHTKSSK